MKLFGGIANIFNKGENTGSSPQGRPSSSLKSFPLADMTTRKFVSFLSNRSRLDSYKRLPYITIAISALVEDTTSLKFNILNENGDTVKFSTLPKKISGPLESAQSSISDLLGIITAHLNLCGNAIILIELDTFYIVPPSAFQYIVNTDTIEIFRNGSFGPVSRDEIIHFKINNIINPNWGVGVIEAAQDTFETELIQDEYSKAKWSSSSSLNLFFNDNKGLNEKDEARQNFLLEKLFSGNSGRRVYYSSNGEAKVTELHGIKPADMQFLETKNFNMLQTLQLFQVAPERVFVKYAGNSADAKIKSILNQYYSHINKLITIYEDAINRQFLSKFDRRLKISFKKYPTGDIDEIIKKIENGIITPAQGAEELGYGRDMGETNRDVYYIRQGLIPVDSVMDQFTTPIQLPAASKAIASYGSVSDSDSKKKINFDTIESDLLVFLESKAVGTIKSHQADFFKKAIRSRLDMQSKFKQGLVDAFYVQRDQVLENLKYYTNSKKSAEKPISDIDIAGLMGVLFDAQVYDVFGRAFKGIHTSGIQRAINNINGLVGVSISPGLGNPFVPTAISKLGTQITKITDTTRKEISKLVTESVNNGLNIIEIQDAIHDKFEQFTDYRVRMIARTESRIAYDEGTKIAFQQIGVSTVDCVGCTILSAWVGGPEPTNVSTCGKKNVPIEQVGFLPFHPNHIGCWAPTLEIE